MSPPSDSHQARAWAKRRILVVDDEPTLRLGFGYALTNKTTEVETAATGQLALDKISATPFDIVILDLRMPDLDGIGVIEALRGQGNSIPIVLCSAALGAVVAMRAVQLGVVDFLLKPVRPADLRQIVDFVLNPSRDIAAQALKAARNLQLDDAILVLENQQSLDQRSACWLEAFRSMRDSPPENSADLEDLFRRTLPTLAFKAAKT